jgi:hypothetical protein
MSRQATFADLISKPSRKKVIALQMPDGEMQIQVQAISSKEYDDLLAAHPPTKTQKADGSAYNTDTFPPALLAKSLCEPKITDEEATEIWNSEQWSRGELSELFYGCVEVNAKGLDVPFT